MSQETDPQATSRLWQQPQVHAAWIALVGVVIGVVVGAVLTFVGQSILAARSIEHERENRLWRERTAAYGSFDLASYDFMRAAHDSKPDELRAAHESVRRGLGPISILGGPAVVEAARVVHRAASIIFAAEQVSEGLLDELSAARTAFKIAVKKELSVIEGVPYGSTTDSGDFRLFLGSLYEAGGRFRRTALKMVEP